MEIEPEVEEVSSAFEQFLGEWKLESVILNGESVSVGNRVMFVEDNNVSDDHSTGYFGYETNPNDSFTFHFTEVENQVVIQIEDSFTLTCLYNFIDKDHFTLDDPLTSILKYPHGSGNSKDKQTSKGAIHRTAPFLFIKKPSPNLHENRCNVLGTCITCR